MKLTTLILCTSLLTASTLQAMEDKEGKDSSFWEKFPLELKAYALSKLSSNDLKEIPAISHSFEAARSLALSQTVGTEIKTQEQLEKYVQLKNPYKLKYVNLCVAPSDKQIESLGKLSHTHIQINADLGDDRIALASKAMRFENLGVKFVGTRYLAFSWHLDAIKTLYDLCESIQPKVKTSLKKYTHNVLTEELEKDLSRYSFLSSIGVECVSSRNYQTLHPILTRTPTIQSLHLSFDQIEDEEIATVIHALEENVGLKELILSWKDITEDIDKATKFSIEAMQALAALLYRAEALQSLSIECSFLDDNVVGIFADGLKGNTTLEKLTIVGRIEGPGLSILTKALKTKHTLRKIDLGFNPNIINSESLENLVEMTGLTSLAIYNTNISEEGFRLLTEKLTQNNHITHLYLNDCKITTSGIQALANMLKTNTFIKKLCLSSNWMKAEGAMALADMLKSNQTLMSLNLADNEIADLGATALSEALNVNSGLQKLNIGYNNITSSIFDPYTTRLKIKI